jgi:hypothetical protein
VWSLIAIPVVTVLINQMSSTVVSAVNRGTFKLADWTVMPKEGELSKFLQHHPRLKGAIERFIEKRQQKKRVARGFELQDPDDPESANAADPHSKPNGNDGAGKTSASASAAILAKLQAKEEKLLADTDHDLAKLLGASIKTVAQDLRADPPKRYNYEQWIHFRKLIQFSKRTAEELEELEDDIDDEEVVDWDWIGENSPMLADIAEAEWVLDRLCESLTRYSRRQARLVSFAFFLVPPLCSYS